MGKVKIKKKSVWIDMTPMSDVMVLLLTFFMLTATFTKNEAVKVNTPGSVSEIKVPEKNCLNILIDKSGKVFLGMDKPTSQKTLVDVVAGQYQVSLNAVQLKTAQGTTNIGVPMEDLSQMLSLEPGEINGFQAEKGLPTDSVDNGDGTFGPSEFQNWVMAARDNFGTDMKVTIKADCDTPYKVMKKVMSEMQDISEDRYYLITTLKKGEEL